MAMGAQQQQQQMNMMNMMNLMQMMSAACGKAIGACLLHGRSPQLFIPGMLSCRVVLPRRLSGKVSAPPMLPAGTTFWLPSGQQLWTGVDPGVAEQWPEVRIGAFLRF